MQSSLNLSDIPHLLAKSQLLSIRYLTWAIENVNIGNLAHAEIHMVIFKLAFQWAHCVRSKQEGHRSVGLHGVPKDLLMAAQPRYKAHSSTVGNHSLLFLSTHLIPAPCVSYPL